MSASILTLERGRPGVRFGIALANQPAAAAYVADAQYARTSSGQPVTVTRTGAGDYTVTFFGLSKGVNRTENVQVSSGESGPVYCTVNGWVNTPSGNDLAVAVRCFTSGGIATDSRFTILVIE